MGEAVTMFRMASVLKKAGEARLAEEKAAARRRTPYRFALVQRCCSAEASANCCDTERGKINREEPAMRLTLWQAGAQQAAPLPRIRERGLAEAGTVLLRRICDMPCPYECRTDIAGVAELDVMGNG